MTPKLVATFTAAFAVASIFALTAFVGSASADDSGRGEELFSLCSQCHGAAGQGMQLSLAPAIAGLPEWYVKRQLEYFRSGARGLHPDDLGGLRMYPMSRWLTKDEDLAAVATYVSALPKVDPAPTLEGGDASQGKVLYGQVCVTCHGAKAEGVLAMNGPPLNGASDWYLLTSIAKFKSRVRGGNPVENPTGAQMQAMSNTVVDEQTAKNVIAYIMSLEQ